MYDADAPILAGLVLLISATVGLLATGALGGSFFPHTPDGIFLKTLSIDGTLIKAELANTPEKRIQGLSSRDRIPENRGMLFDFDDAGKYGIWMKDMRFPLDIYWLDEDGVIVDAWIYARPESYPFVYEPRKDASFVLEVVGGFSEIYNIEIGDTVTGI